MNQILRETIKRILAVFVAAFFVFVQIPTPAYAAQITSLSQLDQAQVSFTFDDGFASTRTLAAPILEARGIDGVLYLTSGSADKSLALDDNQPGATWDQIRELQNTYGWEIGGHMATHPEMPLMTPAQNIAEITNSNAAFAANGLNVTNFASPFGAYDNATLTEILKYYKSHRGFADRDTLNTNPYNKAVLKVQSVEAGVTTAQVQAWIDQAVANRQWLILVFHDVAAQQNPNYVYTTTTAELTEIADYAQAQANAGQLKTVTVEQGIIAPGTNILTNSGFEAGIANGWTTNNPAVVAADNGNHGNYGSPTQSVSFTGGATAGHLFSGTTAVNSASSYMFETFYNTNGLTAGEFGFYIDEYNAAGTWISGQSMGMVANGTIGFVSNLYNPTTATVSAVRVQTYLNAGAMGTAYVDSTNLYNLDGAPISTPVVATPTTSALTPTPEVTITPATSEDQVTVEETEAPTEDTQAAEEAETEE